MRDQANADHSCSCTRNQNKMRNQNKQDIRRKIFLNKERSGSAHWENFLRKISKDMEKNWAKLFIFMIEKTNVGEKKWICRGRKIRLASDIWGKWKISEHGWKKTFQNIFCFSKFQEILQVPRKGFVLGLCLFHQRILRNAAGMCLFWWFSKAHLIYF